MVALKVEQLGSYWAVVKETTTAEMLAVMTAGQRAWMMVVTKVALTVAWKDAK
jgi:hypothetical protein